MEAEQTKADLGFLPDLSFGGGDLPVSLLGQAWVGSIHPVDVCKRSHKDSTSMFLGVSGGGRSQESYQPHYQV